jgi:hypothetical protein
MVVSTQDRPSQVQVPGFCDRLGERVIVPQSSGALLEYLYFVDPLAEAPFFAQALKDRVTRLSTFSHSSYCRVRRAGPVAERNNRLALVSAHVAGRRLVEILDAAGRAGVQPPTSAVLAAARQTMASVALLHDFAPDGFHGAIGPDRLILAGEGRIVIAEHVLGTAMIQAAETWGAVRLWQELGVATPTDPALARDGRRNDVLQVGLVVLAMLLGRTIAASEYPDDVPWLLQHATETGADGRRAPLGAGLQDWIERTLWLAGAQSYTTLLDAQKALAQLVQEERYAASPAAWDSFVSVCETAMLSVQVPNSPVPASVPDAGGEAPGEPDDLTSWAGPAGVLATIEAWAPEGQAAPAGHALPSGGATGATGVRFSGAEPSPAAAGAPAAVDTLFVASKGAAGPAGGGTAHSEPPPARRVGTTATAAIHWNRDQDSRVTDFAAGATTPADAVQRVPSHGAAQVRRKSWALWAAGQVGRLLLLGALLATAAAAVVYAPRVWDILFDERRLSGQLIVNSDPAGASVTVDGLFRGLTPLVLNLRAGSHQLDVQDGGSLQSKMIVMEARQGLTERVAFSGSQDRGGLSISTYPTPGSVTVDGVYRGRAPVNVAGLTSGLHVVAVQTARGTQEQEVAVEAGKLLPVAVQTVSWVKVVAPYDLEVSEDGRTLGTTGSAAVPVSPGHHHLEFSNTALGVKLRQAVDTVPGQLADVPLELPMGTLDLTSDEPAEVDVDGQKVGDTPVSGLAVSLGRHSITFQNAKYGRLLYGVSATLAGPVRLKAVFHK